MADLSPGDFVNHRYQVVRCLGRGAMGTVYLAADVLKVHRLVAMKILRSENLDDPDMWSKGEYQALIRLRHPNLARVYDFGRIQGRKDFFIVSEFIRGQDLLTATRNIPFDELLDIVAQVCRSLEYIHSQGYVHFDIKPDNILVTREQSVGEEQGSKVMWNADPPTGSSHTASGPPRVKLIDFGLAEKITGTFDFAIKGTFNYVAPEIIRGQTPDKRADLYSFGVTLFQILTGRLPFLTEEGKSVAREGNAWRERLRRILDDQPQYLSQVLVRLLEDNPALRFSSAREIIQSLNAGSGRCYQIETAETQASYLYCSRLIGRRKELNHLKNEADVIFGTGFQGVAEAEAGADGGEEGAAGAAAAAPAPLRRVPLLQVSGEIGIGKSRLLEEFTHFLRMREIPIYVGNCYETSKDAYQPFREIITEAALALGRDALLYQKFAGPMLMLCPKLRTAQDDPEGDAAFRPDKDRVYFVDRLAHFLIESAASQPFVMIINNLHWADEPSVELLGYLATEMAKAQEASPSGLPLMLISTMRLDEQLSDPLRDLLKGMREEGKMRELTVRRFTRAQIAELIHHMLQIEEIPTSFLNRLEERTSGNPLFIVETLKGLQEEGIIHRDGAAWKIRGGEDLARVEIPHGLEAILLRRVRMLDPQQQALLQALAVYDKPVSGRLLERFPDFVSLKVTEELRELEERGMVEKQLDGGRLLFSICQPKLREIIYSYVPEEPRKVLHGTIADALANEHQGRLEEIIEDLAWHYQRSDRAGKALELTVQAGDLSRKIYAHERAIEHYRHVLLQTEGDPRYRTIWLQTHEKVGDIGVISGDYDLAESSYDTLLQMEGCNEFGVIDRCRVLRKRGKLDEIQGEYDRALRNYNAAQNLIDENSTLERAGEERICIYSAIGWVYVCMGKYEKAMKISIDALRLTSSDGETSEHAMIYGTIGSANYFKGSIEQAIEYHSRALKIRENLEDVPEIIVCLNNLGASHLANAEHMEALKHFGQALSTAAEIGDAFGRAMSLHHLADTYASLGMFAKAEPYLEESLQLSRQYRMRFLNNQNYVLRGRLRRQERQLAKAEGDLFRAMGVFAKQGNRWGLAVCLYEISELHLERGNVEEALKLAREGYANANSLKIDALEARGQLLEARTLRVSQNPLPEQIFELLESARKLLEGSKRVDLLGEIEQERGEALVKLRRLEEARKAYARSEEWFGEIADRLPSDLSRAYLEWRQVGDKAEGGRRFKEVPDAAGPLPDTAIIANGSVKGVTPPSTVVPATANGSGGAPDVRDEMLKLASLLQEAGQNVSSRILVDKVLSCLVQATGAEDAFLLSRNGDDVRIVSAMNRRSERLKSPAARICLEALEDVIDSGDAILAPRILDDAAVQAYEALYRNNITSLAVVPLRVDGACRGAVYLNNPRPEHLDAPAGSMLLASYCNLLNLILPRFAAVSAG